LRRLLHLPYVLEEAMGDRMDHRNVCDHQAIVWQHHQHVAAFQGRSPCAFLKLLLCRLHGGRNPGTISDVAPMIYNPK
jgi:hypothetical protein